MRKNRILAAVCSLVFVMNCSACGGEQEVLWIGQPGMENVLSGQSGAGNEVSGQPGTGNAASGQSETENGVSGQSGTGNEVFGQSGTGNVVPGQSGAGSAASAQPGNPGGGLPSEAAPQEICVYVCGAVEAPGVVFLPEGSRAADALEAAGGFAPDAAEEAVNLAAKVSDGEKLYFPTGEEYQAQAWQPETGQQASGASGMVNINTADASQLCTLPGIGESRAADIIAYRESHGGFAACEDIMQVSGIKESVYNKISDKITVK